MEKIIGVFDSGIGGLTILDELKNILPNENYFYFGDSKNNPYGQKSDEELEKIVDEIVKDLIKRGAKIIVVACNTATAKCIESLRKKFPEMIFVGTEPAVKLACEMDYKNILVLATPGTIQSERVEELVLKNKKPEQNIKLFACPGLADAIETKDEEKIKLKLSELFDNLEKDFDAVVLGCTHYSHIKNELSEIFPKAKLIDGNKNIAKQVQKVLQENNLLNESEEKGKTEIIFSGDNK